MQVRHTKVLAPRMSLPCAFRPWRWISGGFQVRSRCGGFLRRQTGTYQKVGFRGDPKKACFFQKSLYFLGKMATFYKKARKTKGKSILFETKMIFPKMVQNESKWVSKWFKIDHRMINCLIDSLIHCVIDWLIDRFVHWFVHWLIDWSIYWLIDSLTH